MTFEELNKKIAEAQLGGAKMVDLTPGDYKFHLEGEKIYIASVDKPAFKVLVGDRSVAAMRIVKSKADAESVSDTKAARTSDKYSPLQKAIAAENLKVNENTKLTVVHKITIIDTLTDSPVYRNDCYKGYPDYVKTARKISAMPETTEAERNAKNLAFTEASETLRASGTKSGVGETDKQKLPVFMLG